MRKIFLSAAMFVSALVFTSCIKSETVQSISETELFSLPYGNFEEQLSVTDLNDVGDVRFGIAMQDGFFYIVNGESKKILELNSYGDLLTLFYNEDSHTARLLENSNRPDKSIHHEISYPFDYPGMIAVDSNKNVYTVCSIPWDRQEKSDDGTTLYSHTILRFARDGSSVDYIGQQGPGGTPFPYIKNIYTTSKDELVVVAASSEGMLVYWFANDGFLKYMIPVTIKDAPSVADKEEHSDIFLTIQNVVPDPVSYKLYVQIDYYSTYVDEDSKVQSGINYIQSMLYPLNIETGTYEDPVSVPPYEESVVSDYSKLTYRIPYDFLGVTKSGWKFFIVKTEDGFNIEMIQSESQRILRRHFNAVHSNIIYDSMCLSQDGILTALYLEKETARVVWYRTDNLIDAILKN
ncbi:LIC_12708 family protein [Treponema bryantii]|uniref:LIC_12708 family protein n=1 Tax=Treponema bryantii TaxID=163 RepID=UPI002B27CCA2|nr:lipoprotein [Treponema bryantii]